MKFLRDGDVPVLSIWLVLFVGLSISVGGYQLARQQELRAIKIEQNRITQLVEDVLSARLELVFSSLRSVRGLFLASDYVSREEFHQFTQDEVKRYQSFKGLEWIPRIPHAQREAYREKAITDGLSNFKIKQKNAEGKMVEADARDEYYPVFYVEPFKGNEDAVGFDLASSRKRLQSLQLAQQTRLPQATASFTLVQETARQKGFLIFQPVFKHNKGEQSDKPAPLIGYALGVFRLGDLFDSATTPVHGQLKNLVIELKDITAGDSADELIYRNYSDSSKAEVLTDWVIRKPLQVGGRMWELNTQVTPQFLNQNRSFTPWLILISGLIFTFMVTFYLRSIINQKEAIREQIRVRTEKLAASVKLNKTIVDSAVAAVITIDKLGKVLSFNPAAVKMFGYQANEVIGNNVKMLMPEPFHSDHDQYLKNYHDTGDKKIIGIGREVVALHKDGSEFPINLSVGEAKTNSSPLFVGTITDLTEIKNKEKALSEFNQRLDLAAQAGGIGIWDYDIESGSLNWDDRMFDMYGVKREDFSGAYEVWPNALHPDDLKRAKGELKEAISGGKPFNTEFMVKWPDGQKRYLKAAAVVLFDQFNNAYRMIGTNMDVTNQKEYEQGILDAKLAAENANQQKSAFLNTMSHELRTPLTVILGYLPMLKDVSQMPPPEMVSQIAKDMDISGHHLMEMISDLLDISRIEAGKLNLKIRHYRVLPIVEDILRKFKNEASKKGTELTTDVTDFEFKVDELRLRQIFINLIGNALKFTEQGRITVSATRDDTYVTFKVSDTGVGMNEKELPYIFETFRQVDNSSTRKTGGSGLGLSITKKLVEMHGGTITVVSQVGKGSTFTFTIKQTGVS